MKATRSRPRSRKNPAFTAADRARLAKEVNRGQWDARRAELLARSELAKAAKARAAQARKDAAATCRAEKAQARGTCDGAKGDASSARVVALEARALREAQRAEMRDYRAIERAERARKKSARPLAKARVRRQESDDEVRAELAAIDPSMLAEWERVKRTIHATPRARRAEVFLEHWKGIESDARAFDAAAALDEGERYMVEQQYRRANPSKKKRDARLRRARETRHSAACTSSRKRSSMTTPTPTIRGLASSRSTS